MLSSIATPDYLADSFRLAMRQTGQTVCILSVGSAEGAPSWAGMTLSSLTSVTMTPPMMLFCVHQDASLWPRLAVDGLVCINILAEGQDDLAARFAGTLAQHQRFEPVRWITDGDNIPFLPDALGVVFGRIEQIIPAGTHGIILCAVTGAQTDPTRKPLIYHDGGYKNLDINPPA